MRRVCLALATALLSACSADDTASGRPLNLANDGGKDGAPDASQEHAADVSADVPADTASEAADSPVAPDSADGPTAADASDGPSWIVNGIAVCPEAAALCGSDNDASALIQMCVDRTPDNMALELEPCRYSMANKVLVSHVITLRTRGRAGTQPCTEDPAHGCAELFALPALNTGFGMLKVTAAATIDHLALHGNRQGRAGTNAANMCTSLQDNSFGFNGSFFCNGCTLQDSVSMYALCGTAFLVATGNNITVARSTFAYNGRHNVQNLWSDGLTVHDSDHSTYTANKFLDNTDVDLIFGGCKYCKITGNQVTHTGDAAGGSFVAIMIHKWPSTGGCYEGVDVSGNSVDCGPLRACGSGLYIASEGWYPETPYGSAVDGQTSGLITGNTVVNALNALYIGARGLAIYGNGFLNAHGINIPVSCSKTIVSVTPIVVSPTTQSCHFNYENVDPVMSVHYSSADWSGCVPNYPF